MTPGAAGRVIPSAIYTHSQTHSLTRQDGRSGGRHGGLVVCICKYNAMFASPGCFLHADVTTAILSPASRDLWSGRRRLAVGDTRGCSARNPVTNLYALSDSLANPAGLVVCTCKIQCNVGLTGLLPPRGCHHSHIVTGVLRPWPVRRRLAVGDTRGSSARKNHLDISYAHRLTRNPAFFHRVACSHGCVSPRPYFHQRLATSVDSTPSGCSAHPGLLCTEMLCAHYTYLVTVTVPENVGLTGPLPPRECHLVAAAIRRIRSLLTCPIRRRMPA